MNDITIEQQIERVNQHVKSLERMWDEMLPTLQKPDRQQFVRWIRIANFDLAPIFHGFKMAQRKLLWGGKFNDPQHPVAYISSCANNYPRPVGLRKDAA